MIKLEVSGAEELGELGVVWPTLVSCCYVLMLNYAMSHSTEQLVTQEVE